MTQRSYGAGALDPEGLPRVGHWRRKPRTRSGPPLSAAPGTAGRAAPVAPPPPNELSPEEAAVLQELDITPSPDWFTTPAAPVAPVAAPAPEELVRDLLPAGGRSGPAVERYGRPDYGLGSRWGSTWRWTAQGWVDRDGPNPIWRPVVTTTGEVSNWEHDTYLGVVVGEAAVRSVDDAATLGRALDEGRETALQGLVDAAVARGAHAVVGVSVDYTKLDSRMLVTATGTAVTLRER